MARHYDQQMSDVKLDKHTWQDMSVSHELHQITLYSKAYADTLVK